MRLFAFLLASSLSAQTISTLVGTGKPGFTENRVNNPYGLVIGPDGALYFCDIDNHVVRRFDLKSKTLTTVAGSGQQGNSGDGGPATSAALGQPYEVRFDSHGDLYFVDMPNHVVRKVDRKKGTIQTIAGTGEAGFSGDGGPAERAQFRQPHSIAFDKQGRLLVCDIGNHRVRRIDLKTGKIETWLGNGERGKTTDGGPIEGTPFNGPRAIAVDKEGNQYLVLREGNAVYKIDPKRNRVTHVAGTGQKGFSAEPQPAVNALLNGPKGIALAPDGSIYLADTENHAIRRVDSKTGVLATVAGTGERGDGPDGDPLKCQLNRPHGIYVDKAGLIYIADSESHRIRLLK